MTGTPAFHVSAADESESFDVIVVALGFENRSSFVASQYASRSSTKIALGYPDNHDLSWATNRAALLRLGFVIDEVLDDGIRSCIASHLDEVVSERVRVAVDISCFSRVRLAQIIEACFDHSYRSAMDVTFLYAPARYTDDAGIESSITIAEPLISDFSSLVADPEKPVGAIVGVGFEPNLALGVSEYLDVASVFAFAPTGVDRRYDRRTEGANREFFLTRNMTHVLPYDVFDPLTLYTKIETLVYGIGVEHRVCIVPLGPKIFALAALLVAASSPEPVAIWRFSSASASVPRESVADGRVAGLRIRIPFS